MNDTERVRERERNSQQKSTTSASDKFVQRRETNIQFKWQFDNKKQSKAKRNETFCNGFDVPHAAPSAIYAICEFAQV